jgi:hypothetical protein
MPIITHIICNGCGAVKKEANHWFAVATLEQNLLIRPLDVALAQRDVGPSAEREEYYCGQRCTVEAVGQWMEHHARIAFN